MRLVPQPQASLYEATIENADLEAVLEQRQRAKDKASSARKTLDELTDQAKALIEQLDLGEGAPVRVGRFVLERKAVAGRSVAFDTGPTTRLTIRQIGDLP